MKVLMIGNERKLFEEGSLARARVLNYGTSVEELHVIILSLARDDFKPIQISNRVHLYPTQSKSRFHYILDAIKIGKALHHKSIDLVSSQDPFESGLAAFFVARSLHAKLQLQVHSDFLSPYFKNESFINRIRAAVGRHLLQRADCVRVVSRRIAESIDAARIRLKKETTVLPIYVDIKALLSGERSAFLKGKFPQFGRTILMVSRLEREKNFPLAFQAFASVTKDFPKTGLVIVGSGSEKDRLERLARRLHVESSVIFEGWQQDVSRYYLSASVFLQTSNYEGYGMSLVEAAAGGTPIVTTDVGIAREILKDGASIVNVQDQGGIEAGLRNVLGDPEGAEDRANMIRKSIPELFKDESLYFEAYKMAWEKCL